MDFRTRRIEHALGTRHALGPYLQSLLQQYCGQILMLIFRYIEMGVQRVQAADWEFLVSGRGRVQILACLPLKPTIFAVTRGSNIRLKNSPSYYSLLMEHTKIKSHKLLECRLKQMNYAPLTGHLFSLWSLYNATLQLVYNNIKIWELHFLIHSPHLKSLRLL
jgi:hypothetical protein